MHPQFLMALRALLGQHQQAAQAMPQHNQLPRPLAQAKPDVAFYPGYAPNEQGFPVGFNKGYAPPQLQVLRGQNPGPGLPNMGVGFGRVQGTAHNPGFTPLQNSGFGPGGNPQIGAFQDQPGQLNAPQFNPQANQNGYIY